MRPASGRFVFVATEVATPIRRKSRSASAASGFGLIRSRRAAKKRA